VTNCHDVKNHRIITLWTERGALNHAKSLGTDKAWEIYNMLVDTYYRYKERIVAKRQEIAQESPDVLSQLSPQLQVLVNLELEQRRQGERLGKLQSEIERLKRK
jgi:hypothetical protein